MAERCGICGARGLVALGAPGRRGMLSDGAPLGLPVARLGCRHCGTAALAPATLRRLPRRLYGPGYALNAAPPSAADLQRQEGYAAQISALLGRQPASVLAVGCGNGALLLALGRRWPQARLAGMEPAPGAAGAARQAGLAVARQLRPGQRAALVVSVNVLEHVAAPLAFLRRLRQACAPGGRVVVVCPDAGTPWLEMLMLAHRHCFTPAALAGLAGAAGFAVERAAPAPGGGFQAVLLRPVARRAAGPKPRGGGALVAARRRYVAAWARLDATLVAQMLPGRRLLCFGSGEAARLLRVLAPRAWQRVAALTADDPAGSAGLAKPWLDLQEVRIDCDQLLLAVRPQAQAGLGARLQAEGFAVLRWDGSVPA